MTDGTARTDGPGRLGIPFGILRDYWAVLAFLVVWEAWVRVEGLSTIVMPSPSAVLGDLAANPGLYVASTGATFLLAILGLAVGMAVGTGLAVLTWLSPALSGMLTPLSLVFASVPVVALIPILARIFGYDAKTVLAIVAIITFLPAFVYTSAGLRALPAGADDVFRALGGRKWERLRFLAGPAALPDWSIALRLAAANSVLAATVAEFLMGTGGLGHLFDAARSDMEMPRALGASTIAAIMSTAAFLVASRLERRIRSSWR